MTGLRCTKDCYHSDGSRSFTKGEYYETGKVIHNKASLIDAVTTNDQGESHIIGTFWRHFRVLKTRR